MRAPIIPFPEKLDPFGKGPDPLKACRETKRYHILFSGREEYFFSVQEIEKLKDIKKMGDQVKFHAAFPLSIFNLTK